MVTGTPAKQIIKNGFIADLRVAKKYYECDICKELIKYGEQYYSVVKGGGGLGWLKFPDRVHISCVDKYLNKRWNES